MIRGARAAKSAPSWQDLRAVYSQTAVCRAFRMHGAHILPKPAHFGCVARESCRELAIFPSEAPFGIHEAQNLPRIDARERTARVYCHCQSGQERIRAQSCHRRAPGERISRAFCHRRAPRNAPRENIATTSRPKTHSRKSCHGRTPGFAPHQITAALPAKKNGAEGRTWRTPPPEARNTECWRGWGEQRVRRGAAPSPNTRECSAAKYRHGRQRPETKEGEHFARLLLLFCLRLEWPSGPSR